MKMIHYVSTLTSKPSKMADNKLVCNHTLKTGLNTSSIISIWGILVSGGKVIHKLKDSHLPPKGELRIWNENGECVQTLECETPITCLIEYNDSLVSGHTNHLCFWSREDMSVDTMKLVHTIAVDSNVNALALHQGSLVSATGRRLQYWNDQWECVKTIVDETPIFHLLEHQEYLVSSNEARIVHWNSDGERVHKIETRLPIRCLSKYREHVVSSEPNVISIWNENGNKTQRIRTPTVDNALTIEYQDELITTFWWGAIHQFDRKTQSLIRQAKIDGWIKGLIVHQDQLVTVTETGTIQFFSKSGMLTKTANC
jgi:hypothetical protein